MRQASERFGFQGSSTQEEAEGTSKATFISGCLIADSPGQSAAKEVIMALVLLLILLLVLFGGLGFLFHPLFWLGLILVLLIGSGGYYRSNTRY